MTVPDDLFSARLPGSDQYDISEEIGHGAYSEVHLARSRATGAAVALKHMSLPQRGVLPLRVEREVAALNTVRHPNVVELVDVCRQDHDVCLVLQHCVTDLWQVLQRAGGRPLGAAVAKALAQQLLRALAACHGAGLIHRDVGPTNLLLDPQGGWRLADFGLARPAAPPGGAVTPGVGTRWYLAPEVMFGSRSYGPAADMWAAGCVVGEALTGRPLFPGAGDIDQLCRTMAALGSIDEAAWPGVRELPDWGKLAFPHREAAPWEEVAPGAPPAALRLLRSLLRYDPACRATAEEALRADWFQEAPAPADGPAVAAAVAALLAPPPPAPAAAGDAATGL